MTLARLYLLAALAALALLTVNHRFSIEIGSRKNLHQGDGSAPKRTGSQQLEELALSMAELENRIAAAQRETADSSFSVASAEEELIEVRRRLALTQVELASARRVLAHMQIRLTSGTVRSTNSPRELKRERLSDSLMKLGENAANH